MDLLILAIAIPMLSFTSAILAMTVTIQTSIQHTVTEVPMASLFMFVSLKANHTVDMQSGTGTMNSPNDSQQGHPLLYTKCDMSH